MHFVLVHSLSVGPSTWDPVCAILRERGHVVDLPSLIEVAVLEPPSGPLIARRVAKNVDAGSDEMIAIVTHSNAGFFAPAIGQALSSARVSYVFVDASVPPSRGSTVIVPAEFLSELQAKAEDGTLPRWTEWWDEAEVAPMFPPNAELRDTIIREQPNLPLSYYEQTVEIPAGWDVSSCGYIYFGPPYDQVAEELAQRGWPVRHIPGLHLHMIVDPVAVADALEDVVAALH
ncbi:MAG TPA: alpha/beta hydrolase [Dehalococcoidia bacterium]|nr:alpha/beta hydrolase [Dehalococcoidia bacterium]